MIRRAGWLLLLTLVAWLWLAADWSKLYQQPVTPAGPTTAQVVVDRAALEQRAIAEFNRQVDRALIALECERVADWKHHHRAGDYPDFMLVHQEGSGRLYLTDWTFPPGPGLYVEGLCGR